VEDVDCVDCSGEMEEVARGVKWSEIERVVDLTKMMRRRMRF
jgi:hypothetical protein